MLQTMRNLAQLWVFKALMVILVISFGIWGIGDMFRGNPLQRTVAKVGDANITVQDLNRDFQRTLAQARQGFNPDLTDKQAKELGILDKTLDGIITRVSVQQQIKKIGIDVTPKMVLEWVMKQPEMQNKDGTFNRDLFQKMLVSHRSDEGSFIVHEQESMAQNELFYGFNDDSVPPHTILDLLVKARGQKRILDVVTLANDSIHDLPKPEDKELHEFYDQNPRSFTAPEYRGVTIAQLSLDDVAKDITLSDDDLKKEYDAHPAQFTYPERRDVLQIVVQGEIKAQQIVDAARASGNLPEAAKEGGFKTVALNQTEEKTLLPEIATPVFTLKVGEVSAPVKSPLGWHVFQLKKITPPGTSSFDEVKDKLREIMKRDQAMEVIAHNANKIDDELAAGHALEDIADTLKLRLIKIPALSSDGKTPEGKDPQELPAKADVLKAAFSQNSSETSPMIDDKKGSFVVVRTDEVMPSEVRPFDKVKDQLVTAWKAQEQAKRAALEAEDIANALRTGKTPSSFATRAGVDIRVSKPISLVGENDPLIPAAIYPQILKMKKGEVIVVPQAGRQMILRLADYAEVKPDDAVAEGKVREELVTEAPKEFVQEYIQYLHEIFPAKINQDVFDAVRQEGG